MAEPLYTTAQAAEQLGVSPSTVQRAARAAGISRVGSSYVFTAAQIESLKPHIRGRSGNPNFTPGNDLWQRRKKRQKRA